ncbi:MAG: DUF1850 domain-containing protein [Sulfolobales archaeon]|nr:DUF1850 domain-containing protein [Sulfolobales archaeon]MCX8208584.1 DUF1850 domain-containing protein [Sulfolobales archaeon]MDW8010470.1 DUF1850 domain-containing protein [Sulfolobales archaeon]
MAVCRSRRFFNFAYTFTLVAVFAFLLTPLISVGFVSIDGENVAVVVSAETEVVVVYRHSVELYLVIERYVVENCGLRLTQLKWAGFGAGMPSSYTDVSNWSTLWRPSEGAIAKIDLALGKELVISVKHVADRAVLLSGTSIDVGSNVTLRTCFKVSVVGLLIEYIKLALLKPH